MVTVTVTVTVVVAAMTWPFLEVLHAQVGAWVPAWVTDYLAGRGWLVLLMSR